MPDTTPSQARELAETFEKDRPSLPMAYIRELAADALRSLADQVERVTGGATGDDAGLVERLRNDDDLSARLEAAARITALSAEVEQWKIQHDAHADAAWYFDDAGVAQSWQARALAAESTLAAVTKERDALREALTPSAATKAAYIGEIKDSFVQYDEFGDEQYCTRPVSWDATKATMAMILARAALKETDQ